MSSTEDARILTATVDEFFAENRVNRDRGVLVAYSGGPDSSALVLILAALRKSREFPLHAVYINHNLRDPAELSVEIAGAADICRTAGVDLTVREIASGVIRRTARDLRVGIEAAARRHRYALLDERLAELGFGYLATAHQLDDQTETIVMRLFQGALPRGIRSVNGNRIRPLLSVSRAQIDRYLKALRVRPVQDPSNRSDRYLRNRVRREIVPVLRQQFPSLDASLDSLAATTELSDRFIDAEAKRQVSWRAVTGGFETSVAAFAAAAPAVRLRALFQALEVMAERGIVTDRRANRLPYRFLRPAVVGDYSARRANERREVLLVGHGLELRYSGAVLFWGARIVHSGKRGYLLSVPEDGAASLQVESSRIVARWETSDQISNAPREQSPSSCVFPRGSLRLPVIVRSRAPGDEVSTAAGKKPVKRLLSDLKVLSTLRGTIPVVEDRDGIVALVAGPFGGVTVVRPEIAHDQSGEQRFLRLTVSLSEEH